MQKLKVLFAPRNMTVGAPWKRILEFAIPMLIGNIAQQLYSSTDSVVVGQYVGDHALAAVGSTGPILMFMIAFHNNQLLAAVSPSPSGNGGNSCPLPSAEFLLAKICG